MAFKSEIHVAELASIRTGHTEGDTYYILDNGMLGDLPCKPGDFVKWHNDAWQIQPDEHYALASAVDGEITEAIDNVLDDGSVSESIVVAVPSSQSSNYTVGNYYEVQGKVARLRTKTDGDNVTQLTFDTTSGVLEAINSGNSEIHDDGSKTESDLVEGVLAIASTNSVTKLTLTTAQTLTVLANAGIPNFALEIDNAGNGNDVTVTVKDSTGTTTLKASAAGGTTIDDGAYVQLTCVGGCWTMAVFS